MHGPDAHNSAHPENLALPSLATACGVWARVGLLSFGGPAAQIALLHREAVETRPWVSDRRFLMALNYCTLLPGPEAMQLAAYLGWLMHGVRGGVLAGALFIAPGAAVMLALSLLYVSFGTIAAVAAAFFGLKCAVLALVFDALRRIARRALHGPAAWVVAGTAFLALAVANLPFPVVVLAAGLAGYFLPHRFPPSAHGKPGTRVQAAVDALLDADPDRPARAARAARRAGLACLALWLVPVALFAAQGGLFSRIALFFSKLAVVTFGGAYAVLAYAAQEAVQRQHWLTAGQMLDGLGLAETTPGPLILVLQHVGFMAGWGAGGAGTAILAAALTLWVTFVPCFAWVFLGAPSMERLQRNAALNAAMAAVTASVVGVITSLALFFAVHLLVDWRAWLLSAAACVALFGFRVGAVPLLAGCALAALVLKLV